MARLTWAALLLLSSAQLLPGVASGSSPPTCGAGAAGAECGLGSAVPAEQQVEQTEVSLLQKPPRSARHGGVHPAAAEVAASSREELCHSVGAKCWLSSQGTNYLVDKLMPEIVSRIKSVHIANIHGKAHGFNYAMSSIKVKEFGMHTPDVGFDEDVGVGIDLKHLDTECTFHYSFDGAEWYNSAFSTGGWVKVRIKANLRTEMKLGVSPAGLPRASLDMKDVKLEIGDLNVQGTYFSWLLETLVGILKGNLEKLIARRIEMSVGEAADGYLNDYFSAMDLKVGLPFQPFDWLTADLSLCSIKVGQGHLTVGVLGRLLDGSEEALALGAAANASQATHGMYMGQPEAIPDAPPKTLQESFLSVKLSSFMFNSGFYTLQRHGLLSHTIKPDDVPRDAGVKLNGATARSLMHEKAFRAAVAKGMGADLPFLIDVEAQTAPQVSFTDGVVEVRCEAKMGLRWDSGVPGLTGNTFLTFISPLRAVGSLTVNQGADEAHEIASGSIFNVTGTPVTIVDEEQSVELKGVNEFVDVIAEKTLRPVLDSILQGGFPLSERSGITLTGSKLDISDGSLVGSTNFVFNVQDFDNFIDGV